MRTILVSLFLASLLTLPAHGATVKSTPESMHGDCRSQTTAACSENCDQYKALVQDTKFASKRDCRRACNATFQRQVVAAGGAACERAAGKGQDLCNLYCNQNYK